MTPPPLNTYRHGDLQIVIIDDITSEKKEAIIPFPPKSFGTICWNEKLSSVNEEIIESLLNQGCLFFVFGGRDCELWHDITDELVVKRTIDGKVKNDENIMTTWHNNETIEDVLQFGFGVSEYEKKIIRNYVILTDKRIANKAFIKLIKPISSIRIDHA